MSASPEQRPFDRQIAARAGHPGHNPLPRYSGDRGHEHFGQQDGPHSIDVYASDTSSTKSYHFNAAGFRGEPLDPSARMRVFVCGASYAFGTGLDWEETWPYALKSGLAAPLEFRPDEINVLNFSQSLASANYVTRTLLAQCNANRPDLVVAVYSDMKRMEYFLDGAPAGAVPFRFGWLRRLKALRPGWRQRLMRRLPGLSDRVEAKRRLQIWDAHARLYSPEYGMLNTLTNMLLLQSYCQAHGIECLISWVQNRRLDDPKLRTNPAIAPLIDLLDREIYCPFSIVDENICTDLAADGIHPGAESNRKFAERLAERYRARLGPSAIAEATRTRKVHDRRSADEFRE